MKYTPRVFLAALLLLSCISAFSQVAINSTGATADPSAVLDISSPDKGMLVPRVLLISETDNTSPVNNPAVGLLIYNADGTYLEQGFYVWTGTKWAALATMDKVQNVLHGPESAAIFGELYEYNPIGSYSNIVIPSSGTYIAWNSGTIGDINGMEAIGTSLDVQIAGTYEVNFNAFLQIPFVGKTVDAALFINGIRQDDLHARGWFKEANKPFEISFSGIANLNANDVVNVQFTMDDDGVIRIEVANLNISRLN